MTSESELNAFERMSDHDRSFDESETNHDTFEEHASSANGEAPRPKKITFDDFQITRAQQEAQVEEERQAWKERQDRIDQKTNIFGFAVPRLKSLKDEMIGGQSKIPFFKRTQQQQQQREEPVAGPSDNLPPNSKEAYFADHEKSVIRVTRRVTEHLPEEPPAMPTRYERAVEEENVYEDVLEAPTDDVFEEEAIVQEPELADEWQDKEEVSVEEGEYFDDETEVNIVISHAEPEVVVARAAAPLQFEEESFADEIPLEPTIEPSMKSFLDALRSFDSHPRRAFEARDPRADFVVLLGELLDILRDELDATSAMFFWVNPKRQQLVLESAALDDRAYQFLAGDKRFSIELDAVSRVVSRRKPELHSNIPSQAELDLIPYYRDAIGIAAFAGMPVFFGDSLVAVLTVDSMEHEHFSQETLRILTNHSRLISGLIRSYIEKYDLLASARTLDAARKLHQIVTPDATLRREQRKNPDYVLRTLTEAASDIIDWDWLATTSFDENRRLWTITNLQSKHGGGYVPPMTPISMEESLVGRCLTTGKSVRIDALNGQSIRYNMEEDRQSAMGHSFLTIPIRTSNKNYGTLAIEHSEKNRFSDADVETLEHLARSAASALEIIALGEIVGERALTDLLTGIYNKRGLVMRATEELQRAMQFDEPLTFVMFEIDGSQEFSSRFAQEDSDTIVLAIARLLKFGARNFDVIARTDDFTFAVLLVKMTDEEAYLWSEKMRKMIVSEVIAIGKRSFSVTVSIGVSGARRDGTVDELIQGAELALERAEELGGNNVIVY